MNSIVDPATLVDTRIQLHWSVQILSSAADATLPKADDDSHSNLGWNGQTNQFEGRTGATIDVVEFELAHETESLNLQGLTLKQALDWLGRHMGTELGPRDYDMPNHAVATSAVFDPNKEHLKAIADWFTFGTSAMQGQGDLRVWPHHFDLGFFQPNLGDGKSLGGGFSPGDDHYALPYFYINPYGVDRPSSMPELKHGFWTDKWFGAVITADELNTANGESVAREFVNDAAVVCKQLIAGSNCGQNSFLNDSLP